ncbi:helix-turn-helix transcriptional regulator [Mucilaginibacter sp. KACC 22773]|uniref:helix-turn-helix domain-containing protein n=1 Tax=Mucilaginibacter sp. KACC 22773 TaxID=3025671 RepID=UPI0023670739|nr:response regulator transcription factor [Mucilaginibacter sp. KACC 22773]WDF81126.1 helix-turn-helix transcriptional regulator [Mucilaginibacter sp. KACC 22773]
MELAEKLQSVTQFNTERGHQTLHPLVTVLDQSKSKPITISKFISELYIVFLKEEKCADLRYGRSHYDYQGESLVFIAPGQLAGFDEDQGMTIQPNGWALAFHPDLIRGTSLGRTINDYHYFSYDVRESLHVSGREKELLLECFGKISYELAHPIDKHSRKLIVSSIELLLNYCNRFYDRQFITREHLNKDVLTRFEALLDDYFTSEKPGHIGLPTVAYCAQELHLSAKYFGDLIKKETGQSAQEYIQMKLINKAKEQMAGTGKSISEIAYDLGFKYPQHFTRFFKQKVGQSPHDYRLLN